MVSRFDTSSAFLCQANNRDTRGILAGSISAGSGRRAHCPSHRSASLLNVCRGFVRGVVYGSFVSCPLGPSKRGSFQRNETASTSTARRRWRGRETREADAPRTEPNQKRVSRRESALLSRLPEDPLPVSARCSFGRGVINVSDKFRAIASLGNIRHKKVRSRRASVPSHLMRVR